MFHYDNQWLIFFTMSSRKRPSENLSVSTNKLRLDSINKILKIDTKAKRQRRESLAKTVSRVALSELIKNTPTASRNGPLDFKTFLADKDNIHVFRDFLKSQYCQENLDFFLACERYKRLDAGKVGHELVKFMATQIYNDFLSPDARQPVNIDHSCVKRIEQLMKYPRPELFDEAKAEIVNLMETDCFPRFCKTWQMDKELARKIVLKTDENASQVTDTNTTSSQPAPFSINSSKNTINSSANDLECSTSTSIELASQVSATTSSEGCSIECPYFSISRLPCPGHRPLKHCLPEKRSQHRDDLSEHMDLRKIHKLPDSLRPRRTPPPPPLPPKLSHESEKIAPRKTGSETDYERHYPYVGKVFHV